jgi:hypothetical protein
MIRAWLAYAALCFSMAAIPTAATSAAAVTANGNTQPPKIAAGYTAASLYNQGNAYARAGKPGLAVLYLERARLLTPNDPDIDANLRRVREKAGLPQITSGRMGAVLMQLRPGLLSWLGALGLLVTGASLLARVAFPAHRHKLAIPAALGLGCLAVTAAAGVVVWPTLSKAVVVGHAVPVRVSPVLIEETLFTLPEGETVTVRDEHDGFMLVKTATGRTGWAPSANVAPVIPRR